MKTGKLKQQLLLILLLLTCSNIFNSLKNINNRDTQHGKEIICCHSYAVLPLTIDVETRSWRTTTNTVPLFQMRSADRNAVGRLSAAR